MSRPQSAAERAETLAALPKMLKASPGVFAAVPITHLEAVGYLPLEAAGASDCGLPLIVMEE